MTTTEVESTYTYPDGVEVTVTHVLTDDDRQIHVGTITGHDDYNGEPNPYVCTLWADGGECVDIMGDRPYTNDGVSGYLPDHPYVLIGEAVGQHVARMSQG